ncbi:MAG: hypothetical protein ACYDBT_10440 [Desulfobulbaceae bacterium]
MKNFITNLAAQEPLQLITLSIATIGLLISLILAAFQIHNYLKSSNVKIVGVSSIKIFPYTYAVTPYISVYADIVFFNDTSSYDTEVIKYIESELTIGDKTLDFLDYAIGYFDSYDWDYDFQKENFSSPFSIKSGEVVSRKILFQPKGKLILSLPVGEKDNSYVEEDEFSHLLDKSETFTVKFSALGISGKIYKFTCSGIIEDGPKKAFKNMVTNNVDGPPYQGLTLACQ